MAKRELLRKIDQEPGGNGTGAAGGVISGATRHRMLSATHIDADAGDTPVNGEFMVFYNLWQAMSFTEIIEILGGLFLGRFEGANVGLFATPTDEGLSIELRVTDTGGTPLVSMGSILDVPNTFWVKVGKAGGMQITYLNDGTRDGIEKAGILTVPAGAIEGYLGIEYGATLPDAYDRDPGWLFALISPGDPYSFVLYMRDNLDGWQRLIGAGYAAVHSHSNDETGGLLSPDAGGYDDPAFLQDDNGVVLTDDSGRYLVTGVLVEAEPTVRAVTDTSTEETGDVLFTCNKGTAMTLNLRAATGSGRRIEIANIGAGVVTVDPSGAETINGETTQPLDQWETMVIRDIATGVWVIA